MACRSFHLLQLCWTGASVRTLMFTTAVVCGSRSPDYEPFTDYQFARSASLAAPAIFGCDHCCTVGILALAVSAAHRRCNVVDWYRSAASYCAIRGSQFDYVTAANSHRVVQYLWIIVDLEPYHPQAQCVPVGTSSR